MRLAPGSVEGMCSGAVKVVQASANHKSHRRREISPIQAHLRRRGPGKILARAGPGLRDDASKNFQTTRWHCCTTWSALKCGGAAAPRRRRGPVPAARRGVEVGLWWRLRDGVLGSRGCGLGCLKGAPVFWACVPHERRGEIPGGDRGASVACARRGERDDPDAWARPGSETGRALCGREALAGLRARERVGPREVGRGVRLVGPSAGEGLGRRVWAGKGK